MRRHGAPRYSAVGMESVKVLVAGDLHIGRVSSRIGESESVDFSARKAWDRLVAAAVREGVQLVCLTGDIADESNRFWEAIGPLARGLRELGDAGVVTLAVGGNHDFEALPRLHRELKSDSFRLLGEGGVWERYTYKRSGETLLHVDGWSFPTERVPSSPVDSYEPDPDPAVPTLAMVHGDLGVVNSPYAPLERERLLSMPVDGWLLGHIHAPRLEEPGDRPFILYPGSPQALDPGEPGAHGVWVLEYNGGRRGAACRVPLSNVRYAHVPIDVGGVTDSAGFTSRVRREIEAFAAKATEEGGGNLSRLVLRLTLTGRTPLAVEMAKETEHLSDSDQVLSGVAIRIDRVTLRVLPEIDLRAEANRPTPVGVLAAALLELRSDTPAEELSPLTRALLDRVRQAAREVGDQALFSAARDAGYRSDEDFRALACEKAEATLVSLSRGGR